MPTGRIVVGVDDSAGAADALRWAVAEAEVHGAELVAVLAWGFLDQHQTIVGERFDPSYGEADATAALRAYLRVAVGDGAAQQVTTSVVCDLPASALLDASTGADMLVVGARGLGGFRGLLLGSVSQHCLHHTTVPIAIVRPSSTGDVHVERIVAGVDGSEHSQRALSWAIHEAGCRKAQLDVVTAWQMPAVGVLPFGASRRDTAAHEAAAVRLLDRAIAAEETSSLSEPIQRLPLRGGAAGALVAHSAGADLLVVGSRGRDGLSRALLGSVATQVSHHAPCPLVVIPGEGMATALA